MKVSKIKSALSYLKARMRNHIVRWKHPELQSGKVLNFEVVRRLNTHYGRNGAVQNPITPLGEGEIGYAGKNIEIVDIFKNVELGTWAIDGRTIDWFWDFLSHNKPNVILEFGSGSSTCLFCAWMKMHNPSGIVVSVEQSKDEAEKTSDRLAKHGISQYGVVLPMSVDGAGKIIVDRDKISQVLGGRKVDMLFVDGPAGPDGCRGNTFYDSIPMLAHSGHWFLHDSYRTGELDIIKQWSQIKGVQVDGVLAYGKGLGMGRWCNQ